MAYGHNTIIVRNSIRQRDYDRVLPIPSISGFGLEPSSSERLPLTRFPGANALASFSESKILVISIFESFRLTEKKAITFNHLFHHSIISCAYFCMVSPSPYNHGGRCNFKNKTFERCYPEEYMPKGVNHHN